MSRVAIDLDLTSAAAASGYLTTSSNQPVFIGVAGWGTGGSVTINFTSIVGGVAGTEVALSAAVYTAAGAGQTLTQPVAGKYRAKVTTTGSAGDVTGEISTDASRSW